jgi:transcription elongation factor GreA
VPDEARKTISAEGYEEAKAELEHLVRERRPAIVAAIKAARAEGDLSENAEYHAAREEQGLNEARIRHLEALLGEAEVADAPADGTVGIGSVVRFRDGDDGPEREVTVVHSLEADAAAGKLSAESPVARAMLGNRAGQAVTVETPRGPKRVEILSVT